MYPISERENGSKCINAPNKMETNLQIRAKQTTKLEKVSIDKKPLSGVVADQLFDLWIGADLFVCVLDEC